MRLEGREKSEENNLVGESGCETGMEEENEEANLS